VHFYDSYIVHMRHGGRKWGFPKFSCCLWQNLQYCGSRRKCAFKPRVISLLNPCCTSEV